MEGIPWAPCFAPGALSRCLVYRGYTYPCPLLGLPRLDASGPGAVHPGWLRVQQDRHQLPGLPVRVGQVPPVRGELPGQPAAGLRREGTAAASQTAASLTLHCTHAWSLFCSTTSPWHRTLQWCFSLQFHTNPEVLARVVGSCNGGTLEPAPPASGLWIRPPSAAIYAL